MSRILTRGTKFDKFPSTPYSFLLFTFYHSCHSIRSFPLFSWSGCGSGLRRYYHGS